MSGPDFVISINELKAIVEYAEKIRDNSPNVDRCCFDAWALNRGKTWLQGIINLDRERKLGKPQNADKLTFTREHIRDVSGLNKETTGTEFLNELINDRLKKYRGLERTFKGKQLCDFNKEDLMAIIALSYDINGWRNLSEEDKNETQSSKQ